MNNGEGIEVAAGLIALAMAAYGSSKLVIKIVETNQGDHVTFTIGEETLIIVNDCGAFQGKVYALGWLANINLDHNPTHDDDD